jgi:hypothetical protein
MEARARNKKAAECCDEPDPGLPEPNDEGVRVMPPQRCTAMLPNNMLCRTMTPYGQYCAMHLSEIEGLSIQVSTVAGGGLGLFATREKGFSKGEHVAHYTGDYRHTDIHREKSFYVFQLTEAVSIDAARTNCGSARWANSNLHTQNRANVSFVASTQHKTVRLRAKHKIKKGEEILVSYGSSYRIPVNRV